MSKFEPNDIAELQRFFTAQGQIVKKLPDPKAVRDFSEVVIKNNDNTYDTYKMIGGNWHKIGSNIADATKIVSGGDGGSGTAGVTSFNSRGGVVTPQTGDYTAEQVSAIPISYLDPDGTLTANSDTKVASQKAGKTYSDTKLAKSSNLSDVSNRQTALDNLTDVSSATNEEVLTKDTVTGNAIFKALPAGQSIHHSEFTSTTAVSGLPNEPGETDTYTVWGDAGETINLGTFTVYNGDDGTDGTNGTNGVGVPAGGTTGQVLKKIDGTDYNTEWNDESGGGGALNDLTDVNAPSPSDGQALVYDSGSGTWIPGTIAIASIISLVLGEMSGTTISALSNFSVSITIS